MSVVLDIDDNETYPSRFTIFAGASKNQTKLIKDVYVQGNQSIVQLLDCQEEVKRFYFLLTYEEKKFVQTKGDKFSQNKNFSLTKIVAN